MAWRKVIRIDEAKCDGCGECMPNCAEGAIAIVDGKARLVSEIYCDGLGACLGQCPQGAITMEEREAEPFDEVRTQEHLERLRVRTARLAPIPMMPTSHQCPGSMARSLGHRATAAASARNFAGAPAASELRNWPVQLTLVPPNAPYFRGGGPLARRVRRDVRRDVARLSRLFAAAGGFLTWAQKRRGSRSRSAAEILALSSCAGGCKIHS